MPDMRFAVTGGRDFADRAMVARTLGKLPAAAILVHGAAPGADSLAAEWWEAQGRVTDPHPADWPAPCRATCRPGHRRRRPDGSDYCPAAGVYRNQEMLDSGIEWLIAFPGGNGTADMTGRCEAAGVRVHKAVLDA